MIVEITFFFSFANIYSYAGIKCVVTLLYIDRNGNFIHLKWAVCIL